MDWIAMDRLSWSDHFDLKAQLRVSLPPCQDREQIYVTIETYGSYWFPECFMGSVTD